MRSMKRAWLGGMAAALAFCLTGCSPKPDMAKPAKVDAKNAHAHEHSEVGPHEGTLIEWGDEEYHGEFTVDHKAKQVTVYLLDGTAKKAPNVVPAKITDVQLSITNVNPPLTLDLKHDPTKSNDKGIAFVATNDQFATEMEFKGNVSGKVDGKAYSGDFAEKEAHHHDKK